MFKAVHDRKCCVKGPYILSNGAGEEKDGRQGSGIRLGSCFLHVLLRGEIIISFFLLMPEAPFRG
jgi:hypothetical protein